MENSQSSKYITIKAMIKRDLVIQLRDKWEFVFRVAMLPFILILIYGYVLPKVGILQEDFPNQMFPGMVGMSILVTGIHGTAVPLTMDFNMSREIEDRLQAPVNVRTVAIVKMLVGFLESWIGGLIVLPISLLFMSEFLNITMSLREAVLLLPVLILAGICSATLGLLVGTIVKPTQVAAMFPGFLMPLVFSGAIFFSWDTLSATPIFQKIVLINPLLYVNEALRAVLTPEFNHMPLLYSLIGMSVSILVMGYFGAKRFIKMTQDR